jgi:hypothetical protein
LKNYYELLSLSDDAPADEIKKAFRREIARYHPDKVQHLGTEFQTMAAGIAADLTEAYRILMDASLREKYDAELRGPGGQPSAAGAPVRPPAPRPAEPSPPPPASTPTAGSGPAAGTRSTAGLDFVRRAGLSKLREAMEDTLGNVEPLTAPGFDLAVVTKPKKGLFKKVEGSVCLLVKFVTFVDERAVADVWPGAAKMKAPGAEGCVTILLGSGLAPAKELSAAVSEQRRRSRGAGPVIVPVDVRDWEALFPPETPVSVRALIQRLKDEKR